jgi:thymidylate synthase
MELKMNKYHGMLSKIIAKGKLQQNKKGSITYLLNQTLELKPIDLLELFEGHAMARKKLKDELGLFMAGERSTEAYRGVGVTWWDYCGPILVNSYPTYFEQLPKLLEKINKEKRTSKNYVLFLGSNNTESNQQPCLSLIQFQIENGKLVVSAYQRSSDANLGLPSDIYHLYLISKQIDIPLKSINLFLGNVHVYENNLDNTKTLLDGNDAKFNLNVV